MFFNELDKKNETKNPAEMLQERLFIPKISGALKVDENQIADADNFCDGYKNFLDNSKTEREAVFCSINIAQKAGFCEFDSKKNYKPGDKVYYVNRGKSVIFAIIGKNGVKNGAKITVAHIDSPRLDLKPNPLYEKNNLAMLKTHYYGGIKKYQWTAMPLSLHGIIVKKDGSIVTVNIGENENEPVFCVTDLLPHLAKEQMTKTLQKAIDAENLNVLVGSRPFKSDLGSELVKLNIMRILNEKYGIVESDFLSAELELVPTFKACDVGFDRSMIGAYGHDDRVCAYPSLMAVLNRDSVPENTIITILADKEETGSDGNTGMKSAFFRYFIEDLAEMDGTTYRHVLTNSKCLSADVNAAFDPTYSSVYDQSNSCFLNNGVVITKYTGSGGKFGTTDASAEFMGYVRHILDNNNVLWQTGELGKVDAGGGGTIAKYMANLGMDVVDLGVPVLSMHAPFEIVSKLDIFMAYKAVSAFFDA